jgi:hypothetical protein
MIDGGGQLEIGLLSDAPTHEWRSRDPRGLDPHSAIGLGRASRVRRSFTRLPIAKNRKVILIVDRYAPEPDRHAGSRTIIEFIRRVKDEGWIVKFWPQSLHFEPVFVLISFCTLLGGGLGGRATRAGGRDARRIPLRGSSLRIGAGVKLKVVEAHGRGRAHGHNGGRRAGSQRH